VTGIVNIYAVTQSVTDVQEFMIQLCISDLCTLYDLQLSCYLRK